MGKEGNQAAAFSDYAIPNFKGLRRLLFIHGRIGKRIIEFSYLSLFRSHQFMVPILIMNITNGFSAYSLYRDLYYALYTVTLTVFMVSPYLGFEQDISINFE